MKLPLLQLGVVAAVLVTAFAGSAAASVNSQPLAHSATVSLPRDPSVRFSRYDYRERNGAELDWPVTFVFTGNATVQGVKDGLCRLTRGPWHYCNTGGTMYLDVGEADGQSVVTSDGGVKRFVQTCSTTEFTAHMRVYDPMIGTNGHERVSAAYGHVVVATTHLDFEDHNGCAGRIHGYSDVAEHWFIEAMKTIPNWDVHPDSINLGNGTDTYVVMRKLGGAEVPHVYSNDPLATEVVIH